MTDELAELEAEIRHNAERDDAYRRVRNALEFIVHCYEAELDDVDPARFAGTICIARDVLNGTPAP